MIQLLISLIEGQCALEGNHLTTVSNNTAKNHYDAYLILVEREGDSYFSPEGVCIIAQDRTYSIFTLGSRHNFLRTTMLKFPVEQLIDPGVFFRGVEVKIEDLSPFREKIGLQNADAQHLVKALYESNRELYLYLRNV